MRKLNTEKRTAIVGALVEGNSIASVCRMLSVNKRTVLRLLEDIGTFCQAFHDEHVRGLQAERVQCDEIWSFVHAKDKNLPSHLRDNPDFGSVWTWTALDADDKLMIGWHVGTRDYGCARKFMLDLASRIDNRIQLTTDGHAAYPPAVQRAFGREIDYAMLIKLYAEERGEEARYSPCKCVGTKRVSVIGGPLKADTSTSYVERSNLTMRMQQRRFTRLTNGHSKSIDNHRHAVALHFWHYNWARKHQTLKTTPAVASGLTDHVWTIRELIEALEREEARFGGGRIPRG